jgi:hypothetical protein
VPATRNPDAAGRGWTLPDTVSARLRLALDYPYAAPAQSFTFQDGGVAPFDGAELPGRTPVIAHGSNRAPGQLARKFAGFVGAAGRIPVSYVWLHDYDVVYSAHVTTYGAIASTLHHVPGVRVRVAVTWLDPPQLARMHETEGNYTFGRLAGATVRPEAGVRDLGAGLGMYQSDHGCLLDGGHPVGLAAVAAEGRPHAARTQGQVLDTLRRRLAPERAFEPFVLDAVDDPALRRARIAALAEQSGPTQVPHFQPERSL